MRVVNVAELAAPGWRFVADEIDLPDVDWRFHSAAPRNLLERIVRKPRISRYRAAFGAARDARGATAVLSHMPIMTAAVARAMRRSGAKARHLAVSFNFTDLPHGPRLRLVKDALRDVDRFIVYSTAEKHLYAQLFDINPDRLDFMHWPMATPEISNGPPPIADPYICAVGGEARDYRTLVDAMRALPDVPLVIVTRPGRIDEATLPANVRLLHNLPVREFWNVVRHSTLSVVPLRDGETNCGHITLVGSMLLGRPIVVTRSAGIADYVKDGETGVMCEPANADAMAAAIRELWQNDPLRGQLGRDGQLFAERVSDSGHMSQYIARYLEEGRRTA